VELTDVNIDVVVTLAKQKQTNVFSTKDLVLIKVLHQEKGYGN